MFFKQKTAYEMRISDWSSDVCSSDLSQVYTEIQSGTYAFMDTDYGGIDWGEALAFRHSLFLLGTVMSTPTPNRAVMDFGLKSTSAESGAPQTVGRPGLRCVAVHEIGRAHV